jgi:hypothetical protein
MTWLVLGILTTAGLNLQWSAPAGCPDEATVNARIVRYLGGATPANTDSTNASATVTIEDEQFRVQIRSNLGGAHGERTLTGETCDAVADAVALILAMMVDPDAVRGAQTVIKPNEPTPTAPPAVVVVTPPPPSIEPTDLPIEASLISGIGVLPELAFGVRLGFGVSRGNWSASMAAQFWPESTRRLPLDQEVGGRFSRASIGIRVTRGWDLWRKMSGRVGIGTDGVRTSASGFGVSDPGDASALWIEPLATASLRWEMTRWLALQTEVLGGLPLYRPQFTLVDRGQVWRPPAAQLTWGIGAVLRF